jgi:cytochrome c556
MKRLDLAVCVAFVASASLVVGCGGGAPESSQPAATPPAQAEPASPPPAAAAPPAAPATPSAPTTEEAYEVTMKQVSDRFRDLREHLKGKMAPEAAKEARQLEQLFTGVESFWVGRQTADATKFAKAAVAASQTIAAAAEANDLPKAEAGVKTLDAQCQSCHKAHRIQDGDYYRMQ